MLRILPSRHWNRVKKSWKHHRPPLGEQKPSIPRVNSKVRECEEWVDWKLWARFLVPMAIACLCMIATIVALLRVSIRNQGFVSLGNYMESDAYWTKGLLWTSLPGFLLNLYLVAWFGISDALAQRQPFVELGRTKDKSIEPPKDGGFGGAPFEKSLMADYAGAPKFYSWFIALRNRHWFLGLTMLFAFLMSVSLVPLTGRLFATNTASMALPATFEIQKVYNDSKISGGTDVISTMNLVSAIKVYQAQPPPWTTDVYSFPQFTLVSTKPGMNVNYNLTVSVPAYSANLDCVHIQGVAGDWQSTSSIGAGNITSASEATIHFSFEDRGCNVVHDEEVGGAISPFVYTHAILGCSDGAGGSRFFIFAAIPDLNSGNAGLKEPVLISCIPRYQKTNGSITVSPAKIGVLNSFKFIDFVPDKANKTEDAQPLDYPAFESVLTQASSFDPTDTFQGSIWGRLIYTYALTLTEDPLSNPAAMMRSTEETFSAIFAIATTLNSWDNSPTSDTVKGTVSFGQTRLFVVPIIAYLLVAVLSVLVLWTLAVLFYAKSQESVQTEAPSGLITPLNLLHGSDLDELAKEMRGRADYDGRFGDYFKRNFDMTNARARMMNPLSSRATIEVHGLRRKGNDVFAPVVGELWKRHKPAPLEIKSAMSDNKAATSQAAQPILADSSTSID